MIKLKLLPLLEVDNSIIFIELSFFYSKFYARILALNLLVNNN